MNLCIVNKFNNYFREIGSRIGRKVPAPNGIPEHTVSSRSPFYLHETSKEGIKFLSIALA